MPPWAKSLIEKWTEAAGINAGDIFRPVNKGDHVTGEKMTAQSVFVAVRKYAKRLGANSVSPHDLRRLNAAFFTMNGVIATVFLVFVAADLWMRR